MNILTTIVIVILGLCLIWFTVGNKIYPTYHACNYCNHGHTKEAVTNLLLSKSKILCTDGQIVSVDFESCGTNWYGKTECNPTVSYNCKGDSQ